MTDSISGFSSAINSAVANSSSTTAVTVATSTTGTTTTEVTSSTKSELKSLNIDTSDIKTEDDAKVAIARVERKAQNADIKDEVEISDEAKEAAASDSTSA